MGLDYTKLRVIMAKNKLNWTDIHENANVGWSSINKINKEQSVTLATLEKICLYLECNIGDIVDITRDSATR